MTTHVWLTRGGLLIVLALLGAVIAGPLAVAQQRGERRAPPPRTGHLDLLIDDQAAPPRGEVRDPRRPVAVNERGPAEARIAEALQEKTDVDFTDQPLSDVVDYLKDRHGIEIQLDQRALEDAGFGSDTPITRNLKGISLAATLDLLLSEYKLTYLLHDEVLLITSTQEASAMLETRVYPVGDLLAESDAKNKGDRYEALVETIAQAIGGEASKKQCSIRAYPPSSALVVHQPQAMHRKVEDVLSQLRRAREMEEARERR